MKQFMTGSLLMVLIIATTSACATDLLQDAASRGDIAAIEQLIADGANVNARTVNGRFTALLMATQANRVQAAKTLIELGADVNAGSTLGATPLHVAAGNNNIEIVDLLIAHEANPNAQDYDGITPLHKAAQYGHVEVIERLLAKGADIHARTSRQGLTPLHWLAFWGNSSAADTLLEHGSDINARDNRGFTPLAWAEAYDHSDMARLLYSRGARRRDMR